LGFGSYQVGYSRVSSHLASDHFGFRVISGWVGSGIRSYSVGSFQISGQIRSGIGLFRVGLFRVMGHIGSGLVGTVSRVRSGSVTSSSWTLI
jgi:hypothetical protein